MREYVDRDEEEWGARLSGRKRVVQGGELSLNRTSYREGEGISIPLNPPKVHLTSLFDL